MQRWCCDILSKARQQAKVLQLQPKPTRMHSVKTFNIPNASHGQLKQQIRAFHMHMQRAGNLLQSADKCSSSAGVQNAAQHSSSILRSTRHFLKQHQQTASAAFWAKSATCQGKSTQHGLLVQRQDSKACQSSMHAPRLQQILTRTQPASVKSNTGCRAMFSSKASATAAQGPDAATLTKARGLAVPVGLLAGVFGSFVGVGGGVLIVPLLTGACRALPQRLVSGTSLVAVVSTALASSYTYLSHGVVDTAAALLISCCAVLTAPLGANLTATLDALALKRILGYFLIAVAFLVPLKSFLFQKKVPAMTADPPLDKAAPAQLQPSAQISWSHMKDSAISGLKEMSWSNTVLLGMTGATAGVASGLLGIGGGTVVTPLLAILTPLSQTAVLGSSLLAMVPPSCVGLAQHARLGNVDWRMAAGLAAGTALGSSAGSKVAVNAPTGALEGIFSVGMLFLGWRTLAGARQAIHKVAAAKR